MSKVPLTVIGAEKLRVELHRLKTIERPSVIAAIAEARAHGDLSENAEYDAAKERQGFVEGRIQEDKAALIGILFISVLFKILSNKPLSDIAPELVPLSITGMFSISYFFINSMASCTV